MSMCMKTDAANHGSDFSVPNRNEFPVFFPVTGNLSFRGPSRCLVPATAYALLTELTRKGR